MCYKNFFVKFTRKHLSPRLFFKLQAEPCNFVKKDTPTQVFSCNFWETFQNIFFYRTTPEAASVHSVKYLENESI